MATTAIRSEFSVMNIIVAVAHKTAPVDGRHFAQWATVAFITGDADVGTRNRKIGLQVVIKNPLVPVDRVMALVARLTKVSAM